MRISKIRDLYFITKFDLKDEKNIFSCQFHLGNQLILKFLSNVLKKTKLIRGKKYF